MYILQAALQKKQKLQDSLNFGTGAAPQREGWQVTTEAIVKEEATEDQQQEEELKAVAANNNNNDGCCEEAADCELFPLHKPAAAAGSQDSQQFGSLLGKRNQSETKDLPENQAKRTLLRTITSNVQLSGGPFKK